MAERLALLDVPVILTLEWGKEVEDPDPEEKKPEAGEKKPEPGEGEPEKEDAEAEAAPQEAAPGKEDDEESADPAEEVSWEYEEPLGVRRARRARWEEVRDCALRLEEAGVRYAFGTNGGKPKDLLENVRALVEAGLAEEAALAALTVRAAAFVDAELRLGRLASGMDATLVLWDGDPLLDKKAEPAWVFVDGFGIERERKPKKEMKDGGAGPAGGVDATGTWTVQVTSERGVLEASMELVMTQDGAVTGEYTAEMGGMTMASDLEGSVSGAELELAGSFEFGESEVPFEIKATLDGDTMEGTSLARMPWVEDPEPSQLTAERDPRAEGGVR